MKSNWSLFNRKNSQDLWRVDEILQPLSGKFCVVRFKAPSKQDISWDSSFKPTMLLFLFFLFYHSEYPLPPLPPFRQSTSSLFEKISGTLSTPLQAHSFLNCPKINPNFRHITWNVEENMILHEISALYHVFFTTFYVISRKIDYFWDSVGLTSNTV